MAPSTVGERTRTWVPDWPCSVAQVLRPGIVETLHRHVDVDCESSLCRGRTVVDLWHRTGNEPNTDVGVDVDANGFLELLCGRLASL